MKIQRILKKPHPFIFNQYSVLLPSFITFLILVIFKPFEFGTFETNQLIILSVIFTVLVGLIVVLCVALIKRYFRKTIEENWTVLNEILLFLFILTVISLVIYVILLNLNHQANRFELFWIVVLRTLAISFFPILILVLYEQNHHQKIKRQQAERLNQELMKKKSSIPQKKSNPTLPAKIMLTAENKKIAVQIDPMDLFFVKSDGNYVEIFYQHKQGTRKELIRNSLKAIEKQLPATIFFRCHKSFVVNLQHILKVEGNARNLELILKNIEEKIPVSRGKSKTMLQLFQKNP